MSPAKGFAAAVSRHPITATAVGEVAGEVLERIGTEPDLAIVFVTPHHGGALEDAAAAVRAILSPAALIGCSAVAVLATGHEVEDEAGVALWAGRIGPVLVRHLDNDHAIPDPPFQPSGVIALADPYSFDAEAFFAATAATHGDVAIVGGNASAAVGPGGNRLVVDDRVHTTGAVVALLGPGVEMTTIVSQGCRPIGQPWVVTKAERNIVYELGGEPAYQRLLYTARHEMTPEEVGLVNNGLHLGQVIDEHKADFGRGDFLVRNVLGADQEVGAIAVNEIIPLGATVQYHVRDAATASEDLETLLRQRAEEPPDAALLFTCNGRGRRLFGRPHHDAGAVDEHLGVPTAGFFAAGEFGPVGGRTFVHGFTASVALLRSRPR